MGELQAGFTAGVDFRGAEMDDPGLARTRLGARTWTPGTRGSVLAVRPQKNIIIISP